MTPPILLILGFLTGALGTLIGAGGGFIMVPVLMLVYPHENHEVLTAISLAVIFCNASSGSLAYARARRIDYRSALVLAAVGIPGIFLGVWVNHWASREQFQPVFGTVLCAIGTYLFLRKNSTSANSPIGQPNTKREWTNSKGITYRYSFDNRYALALSSVVGFVASFLGIGGGIIHVPALVNWFSFPVHVATATSHLVLALTTLVATAQHALMGTLTPGLERILWLAPGVVLGAPLGARLSQKMSGSWILKALALALILVGMRLVLF